jgi:hypothetical protein
MYRDLKPCIRCEGMGKIPVLDLSRPEVLFGEEWPMRDATCHGCNGTGRVPVCEPTEVERVLAGATVDAKGAQG